MVCSVVLLVGVLSTQLLLLTEFAFFRSHAHYFFELRAVQSIIAVLDGFGLACHQSLLHLEFKAAVVFQLRVIAT